MYEVSIQVQLLEKINKLETMHKYSSELGTKNTNYNNNKSKKKKNDMKIPELGTSWTHLWKVESAICISTEALSHWRISSNTWKALSDLNEE